MVAGAAARLADVDVTGMDSMRDRRLPRGFLGHVTNLQRNTWAGMKGRHKGT